MLRRRFPHVPIVEGQLDSAGRATSSALQAAFDDCTVFIQNSGMHFNRFWDPPLNMLDACRTHRKPLCLYGQSFDGLPSGHETTLPARLSETALITTRDRDSLAFLRSLDVRPRGGLSFGPDGCFGIDVRDDAAAEAFLEKNALLPGEFITVTLRTNTPKLHTSGGDALNPAKPTAADEAQDARWAATLERGCELQGAEDVWGMRAVSL